MHKEYEDFDCFWTIKQTKARIPFRNAG